MSLILSGTDGLSDIDGSAATPAIRGTDANTGIFFPAADTIAFSEGGVEAMRIDSSGNLGIGTTSPTNGKLVISGNSVTTSQGIRLVADSADARFICESATLGAGILGTFSAHAQLFYTNSAERMRIDSSGNVGIGTSSPTARLHSIATSGTTTTLGRFEAAVGSYTGTSLIACNTLGASSTYNLFSCITDSDGDAGGPVTEFLVRGDGSVLVGTTTNVGANAKIFALGSGKGIAVGYGTGSSAYRHLYMNNADATLYFFNDTNYASLSSAGAWTNASDARLKKNIVNIKYGLADVLRLQPRSYQMNDVAGNFVGFVAQELQTVIPEVVSGDPEKQLGVDYGSLVAVAFKAIQEQQALITALTARIAALENT